jgi:ATP-dependent Clp protease ATP-binding subunit ClpA
MFERFTERARQVVVLAQEEARDMAHSHIGTEHILLGLLREEGGLAGRVLSSLEVNLEAVRAEVVRLVPGGNEQMAGQIPFTPRAKQVLELALREALSLGHNYIGTEHILLALVRENGGILPTLLTERVEPQAIRDAAHKQLGVIAHQRRQSVIAAEREIWRQTEAATAKDVEIAGELTAVIKRLGGNSTLEYRYAGYRRVLVDDSREGIRVRVETCEPVIPAAATHDFDLKSAA